jgi:hypothetical protein
LSWTTALHKSAKRKLSVGAHTIVSDNGQSEPYSPFADSHHPEGGRSPIVVVDELRMGLWPTHRDENRVEPEARSVHHAQHKALKRNPLDLIEGDLIVCAGADHGRPSAERS